MKIIIAFLIVIIITIFMSQTNKTTNEVTAIFGEGGGNGPATEILRGNKTFDGQEITKSELVVGGYHKIIKK